MIKAVNDWSKVKRAIDVGCGSGILVNAMAMQLKKDEISGYVIGLDQGNLMALKTAVIEGVEDYGTCKECNAHALPFSDNYFDVLSSALYNLHEPGTAADQRIKGLEEIVRVLKPGGFGVVWCKVINTLCF